MSNVSKEIAIELVEDGQAGNGIVSVTRTYGISASGTTASDTTSPSDITTWSAGSPTVTTAKPYLWVKEVTVYTETPDTTKYYCVGKRGDNGIDAKDFEWAYIRTTTPIAPTILNDSTYTDSNSKAYTSDGHLPHVTGNENIENNQSTYECTDDPKGVTDTWKYEWEIKRTKGAADAITGARTWNYYSGTMTMHNNYAESAFIIDIDNDSDQFGTDSESKVLVEQTRSTNVTVYDGATPQTLTSLTATLKYEDGTSVPTSVATKTTDATTGAVSVTVKQSNTANTHTEIQAHISAVCDKGTKTIVFTLYKVMSGAPGLTPIIYNVLATNKTFSFQRTDSNELTPSSRTSQINVARTEGNTTTTISSATTGLTYSWGFEDEANAINEHSGLAIGTSISISNTDASSHSSVWVLLSTGDRETLAIVKDGAKGDSGTSVEAQYAPNASPTSSQIHTTFQNGDKYMRTKSGSGSWSGWQKIVGENGAETDFTFNISNDKTSTNASTAPANCYYNSWQDAPIAVTTTYPYLWAKVVQKDGDGTIQSTRYIRLTGEDGKSVLAQYSVDGSSNWHTTFATGDEWMRTSDNGGTSWSAAMKIVGEDGDSTNFEFGISQYQTANGAPSDISTWSDAPIVTTSSKPYLWSKVTTPDGTVSYIRLTGEKGASITKSSEVNTYKVSDSGTTTPTGTWYSTKAEANNAYAWSANRYMWTKTVITWSDTSTTTLYSAERNPDDGDAGMSIVIASQSVTYSKQTSGNLDPTTLTYGSYPSSLSKGDWLYSKTTVNYQNSQGQSAGSTNSYAVSYIGTDGSAGAAGRGITGVYEHYKASANATGETTPTSSSSEWGTNPSPSDWGASKPYLWNYERITYSKGTTTERTTASVIAVWTENGKGVDSITNFYKKSNQSSGVGYPASDPDGGGTAHSGGTETGWSSSVQAPDETNQYLWNYERVKWIEPSGTYSYTYTDSHVIGHYGKDGKSITLDTTNSSISYAFSSNGVAGSGREYPSDITSWSSSVPTAQQGKYLWTRDITAYKYSDNTSAGSTTTYGVSYYATDGDSVEIDTSRTNVRYSTQKTSSQPADSTFTRTTPPTLSQGDYLWCRSQTAYVGVTDVLKSYSVSRVGVDGDNGDPGTDGYTTHFAYATSSDGSQNFSTTNFSGATYIGTYRDQNAADSTTYTDYVWTQWKGDSITRSGNDTYRYATNNTGTRPAASSSSWSTTKPTLNKGYWLYTETTVHWSDGSTTVFYTDERNPNDGNPGMDIVAGTTTIQYKLTETNVQPTSGWGNYPSTLTQGWYLWSKATTPYYKGQVGGTSAGESVTYNVSYIAEDGAAGRSVTSVTEYYKASANSSGETAPSDDSGWSTNPNTAMQSWNQTNKYLWNYEKATYSSGTTVERSTPAVIAIWTKDGNAGKGIDSITNYYLINNSSTAPSRPSTDGTGGWSTTPTPPNSSNPYLWNYEKIVWLNPSSTTYTDVQMIGHYGKDGVSSLVVDLDNDSDQFGTDSNGVTQSEQQKATNVKLFYGTTPQTITKLSATVYLASAPSTGIATATATSNNTEVTQNVNVSSTKVGVISSIFNEQSGTITLNLLSQKTINNDFIVKIEAFCDNNNKSRTSNFTIKQVKSGEAGVAPDLCNLRPTLAKVSFTKSELSGSTAKKLGCGYTLVTPSGTTNTATAASVSVKGTTYYIWWRYVGGTYAKFTTSSTIYSTGILPSTTQTGVEFVLSSASAANNIAASNTLDYENVPIIKDGTDGKGITSANVWYALNQSSTSAPFDFTLDDFPSTLNSGYYVWEATKVTYTDGSSEFTGKMCLGATTEFLTGTEVYAASASNSTTPTSWSTTYTKTKGYYLWAATRVQYTNGTYAYLNPKCVGYWGEDGVDAVRIDLDNQSDMISLDDLGKIRIARNVVVKARIYNGSTSPTSGVTNTTTESLVIGGCTPTTSLSSGVLTITWAFAKGTAASATTKTIKLTYGGVEYAAVFTLGATTDSAIYQLVPSLESLSFNRTSSNTLTPPSISVSCGYVKITADGTSAVSAYTKAATQNIDGKYYIFYRYINADGTATTWTLPTTNTTLTVSNSTTYTSVEYCLTSASASGNITSSNIIDKETIPVMKDGEKGDSWRIIFRWGDTATTPTFYGAEVKEIPCESDYSCSYSSTQQARLYFRLQKLVNGVWTNNSDYYIATTWYDGNGNMKYGWNSSSKSAGDWYQATSVNRSDLHDLDVFFLTAVAPETGTLNPPTQAITSNIFMSTRISKVPKGVDGTSPYFADLDNEMGGVACDSNGYTTSEQYIETNAQLFKGTVAQTLKSSGGVVCSIAGYPLSSNYTSDPSPSSTYKAVISGLGTTSANIKVYAKANLFLENVDIKVTLTDTNNVSRDATLTMNGVRGGVNGTPATIFSLLPSTSSIKKNKNGTLEPTSPMTCDVRKVTGNSTPTRATSSDGTLYYKVDGDITSTSTTGISTLTINTGQVAYTSSNTYITFAFFKGTTMLDKERVPIVYDGTDGTSPIVVDLTNENDSMVYDEFGVLKSGNVTSEAKLYVGSQDKSADATWTITPTNCTLSSGNNRNIVVTGMSALSATVTAVATYPSGSNNTYTAILSLKKLINEDKYELDVTPVSIGYNSTTNTPASQTISVSIWKVSHVDGSRTRSNPPSGYAIRLYKDGSDTSHAYSGSYSDWVNNPWTYTLSPLSSWSSCLVKLNNGTNNSTSAWLDYETIPIAKTANGASGTSPYIADLDNEMDSVACDKNGKVKTSTTCGTNVSLFYGSSKRSYKITGITKNGTSTMGTGVTVKIDDSTPSYPTSASQTHTVSVTYATTATISSKDDFAITLQDATDTSITRVLHFTINGVREGANGEPAIIFRLNPNVSEIVRKKDGSYIPAGTSKVTCAVLKTTGSETSEEPIDETDDYVAKYKLNGTGSEVAFPINGITVSDIISKLEIFLYNADSSILLDKETIPLVEDGTDGTSPYFADLDNEMDSIACTSAGAASSSYDKTINVNLWHGSTPISLTSLSYKVNGGTSYEDERTIGNVKITPSKTNKTVRIQVSSGALVSRSDITITIAGTGSGNHDLHFILNPIKAGDNGTPATIFSLLPSVSAIKRDANNVLTPTSLTCDVRKITGNSTPTRATSSDGTLRYRVDGDITSTSDGTALTINTGTVDSYTATSKYITFAFFKGTTLVDKERVPIVYDGAKGDAGNGYKTIVYRDNFTEAQWAIYGAIDHTETWNGTSSARNGCGIGDWFLVAGTATDSKDYHTATYECDNSSSNLHGKCINHQVTKNAGQMQTNIIRESHFNTLSYWTSHVGEVVTDAIGDHKGFRMENNTSSSASISFLSQYMINSSRQWLSPSTIYTLSWWVKSAVSTYSYIYEYAVDTSYLPYVDGVRVTSVDGNYGRYGRHDWAATGNDWVYHTFTFKTNSSFSGNVLVLWGLLNAASGSTATICMPKLELGDKASGYMLADEEIGESYRILYTWNNSTKIEVKDLPCNADYSGSFSGNFYFYLQRLVDGKWTDCPNYYWAIKGFNSSGGIYYGYNGSTKQAANSISSSTVNDSTNRYFEVYFLTEAMTPAGVSTTAVTETTTRKIFMSSRISKVPAGDGGLSISITPSTLVVNTDENGVTEAASQDFTIKVYKGKDEVPVSEYNVTHSSLPNNNWTWTGLYYNAFRIQCPNGETFTTPTAITVTVALSSGGSIQTSVLLVPNRKGADGASAIHLDLDNEMDSILYSGGSKVGDSVTSQATLYNGGAPIDSDAVTFDKDSSSTATGIVTSAGLVTVTGLPSNSLRGVIVVKATYNQVDYFATFTVDKIVDKPKYEISVDKSAIVTNTDTTSASQSLVVRIWKSEVNSSGGITRTNITSLGNDLKLFYQVGSNQPSTISYSSGSGTVSSITATVGQVVVWLTDSTGSSSSKVTGLLDIETVPVAAVQNGQQGIQGKMGRTPYYWGKWSEKTSTDTFTVNDYMTPYVATGETGSIPQCWIFVGANGSYTKSTAGDPSNSNTKWQLMTSDFEYLITKAIFSDFAKLGSGIFNGDYAFSQWGTNANGERTNLYQNFMPFGMNSQVKVTNSNTYSNPISLGTFSIVSGHTYKFSFELDTADNNINFYPWGTPTSTTEGWHENSVYYTRTYTAQSSTTLTMRVFNKGSNTRYVKVQIIDTTFNPNLYIDWYNGEIYAQLGRFVNVTVEGVINNLIQEITSENYTDYGVYTSGKNTDAFWLNTAKVGSIIRYKYTKPLGLPSAYANAGEPVETYLCDSGDGTHQMTLNELRQCIGKKIYVLTDGNTGMAIIRVGKYFSSSFEEKMLLYNNTWYYAFSSNTTTANWFWVFECKMGERNGRECIYWELLASHNKLPDNLAF